MKKLAIAFVIIVSSAAGFGQQYPMLEDVKAVSVTIDHAGAEPNNPAVNWPRIQLHLARKVSEAGISIEPVKGIRLPGIPDLNVTVMMIEIPETEQFVFHIETSLYRLVHLPENSKLMISAPVWADLATMQSVAAEDVDAAVTKTASRQVGKFIEAWQSAQPKSATAVQNTNVKNAAIAKKADSNTPKYVASKNGKVFHCADCATAKGLSADNLVTFVSRDDAINSGRRPCKKCNP